MFIRLTAGKMGPDGSYNSQLEVRGKRIRQEGILGLKDKYRILRKGGIQTILSGAFYGVATGGLLTGLDIF